MMKRIISDIFRKYGSLEHVIYLNILQIKVIYKFGK